MSTQRDVAAKIAGLNWEQIATDLNVKGHSHVKSILLKKECDQLIAGYEDTNAFRKTVSMERYRFGQGEYKYWDYPLPPLVQVLRETLFPFLVPIVNDWNQKLKVDVEYPNSLKAMQRLSHDNGQLKPTPLMLKYEQGGYNTLHQDLYGDVFFPLQTVFNLSEPEKDFTGGEFILSEQVPRAQSKATVLNPGRGDMIIFTTNFRPMKSARGYYRVKMRHGVSEVRSGHRNTVGIIFHDAEK